MDPSLACFLACLFTICSICCRFVMYWLGCCVKWTITIMSIERFLAIYFPIRTKTLISKKKVVTTMIVTALAMAALNLHFFWTYGHTHVRRRCRAVAVYISFILQYWNWINFVFYSLLPFIIQVFTSISIIRKIIHSNYLRKHRMNITEGAIKVTSMTITLLSVSLVFLMATAPIGILRFVFIYYFLAKSMILVHFTRKFISQTIQNIIVH